MAKNHLMAMAEFIHSHPEHQMQPPRVWRTHYEDECKEENKAYSFSALKQYPTLVKIRKSGRNNCYGSAKLPSDVVAKATINTDTNGRTAITVENKTRSQQSVRSRAQTTTAATAKPNKVIQKPDETNVERQLNLRLTPESGLEEIERVMQQASAEIKGIVRQLKTMETSKKVD